MDQKERKAHNFYQRHRFQKQTWGSANTLFMLLIGPYGTPLPSNRDNHVLVSSSSNLGTNKKKLFSTLKHHFSNIGIPMSPQDYPRKPQGKIM